MTDEGLSLREELRQFGFSDKEIDTYVALLDLGEAKATEIASLANVSKRYVYDVMERFEEKGFVYINDYETPTTIKPLEPKTVTERLNSRVSSLEGKLESRYSEKKSSNDHFLEVVKSDHTVFNRLETAISDAEDEILLSLPYNQIANVSDALRSAVADGVFAIVLVHSVSDKSQGSDVKGLGTIVRTWEKEDPTIALVDFNTCFYHWPQSFNRNTKTQPWIISNGYLQPLLYSAFFGHGWQEANEVHLESPFDLPHTYYQFRHAAYDAIMYHRRGEALLAEFQARPARSDDDFESIQGEIIDIKQGLVKPEDGQLPIHHSFVINSGGEVFTISDIGGFLEDYETKQVQLKPLDGK